MVWTSKNQELLQGITNQLHTLMMVLTVADPKASVSGEAYDGLRKLVISASGDRQAHLVQVAELNQALERGAGVDDVRLLADRWARETGVIAVSEPSQPSLYDVAGSGDRLDIRVPAYADKVTGALLLKGHAEWVPGEPKEVDELPEAERDLSPTKEDVR